MRLRWKMTLLGATLGLIAAGILAYRYYTAPISLIGVDLDRLGGIQQFVPRPVAWAERAVTYEGEDIWVGAAMPLTGGNLDSLAKFSLRSEVPVIMRVFQGHRELRDSLFKPPATDLPLMYAGFLYGTLKPGDSTRWRITQYASLPPGKYWGMVDAGKFSKKFRFRVDPVPDSLAATLETHRKLNNAWRRGHSAMFYIGTPDTFFSDVRLYATSLLARPKGRPLRMEGLRFCANILLSYNNRHFENGDSLLFSEVVEQWAQEPRMEPSDIVRSLERLCRDPLDETCITDMARNWGGQRLLSHVEQWQDYRRRKHSY